MYVFKEQLDISEIQLIDKVYRDANYVSVYQHPLWPDFLRFNQKKRFLLQKDNEKIVLSAKVIESHLTKAPFIKYAHVVGGFISCDISLIPSAIKEIYSYYTNQVFAKLTVELACDLQNAEYVERTLFKEGMHFNHDLAGGARATIMLDLTEDLETIHNRFANVLKRNIVTAQKKGAQIKTVISNEQFEKFLMVFTKMEEVRGVKLADNDYLKDLLNFIQTTGLGHFLACYDKTDTLIGGILLFKEGSRMEYVIGASHPGFKSIPQSHLALYEGIKLAQQEGFKIFDFGGYGFNALEGSQIYSINQFKAQFGGQLSFYPKNLVFTTNKRNAFIGDAFIKIKNALV
jgi:Acetyltransferase (GNAT) domain